MSKKHNKKNNNSKANNNQEPEVIKNIDENEDVITEENASKVVEEVEEKVVETVPEEPIAEEVKEDKNPPEEAKNDEKPIKEKNNKGKTKFSEKLSLLFRKKMFVGTVQTWIIALLLVAIYVVIAYGINNLDLPDFDLTANKLYSISDESAEAVKTIDQDITIYYFGFDEKSVVVELLKKYTDINDKIKVTELTPESNLDLATEYNLVGESASGYQVLIVVSGDHKRLVDSTEFYTYDYTTGQQVDTTEQVMTNTLLRLAEGNQPNVYFVTGHEEFSRDNGLVYLDTLFEFEVLQAQNLNIATQGIPDDCDVLVFASPRSDLLDSEVQAVTDYINKGGDLYIGFDTLASNVSLANFQKILDMYGAKVVNGYLVEENSDYAVNGYPYIFNPHIDYLDAVTKELYTSGKLMWLIYPQAIQYESDEKLNELNVTKTSLLFTSDEAKLITNLSENPAQDMAGATQAQYDIAARLTKRLDPNKIEDSSDENLSNLILVGTSTMASDYTVEVINPSAPLVALGGNKDFVLNAFNNLAGNENIVSIRKDMGSATYTPTDKQNNIVLTIIFAVPVIIIISGVIIYVYRRKRK